VVAVGFTQQDDVEAAVAAAHDAIDIARPVSRLRPGTPPR
jgi:hypothetical protein